MRIQRGSAARLILLLIFVLAATRASAAASALGGATIGVEQSYVGLYSDVDGTNNCLTIPAVGVQDAYLVATLAGETSSGILGVELRVQGLPEGWIGVFTPDPSILVVIGDLFEEGVAMAYPTCQLGQGGKVVLGVVTIVALTDESARLQVVRRDPPSNPTFPCPLFFLCDNSTVCMRECPENPTMGISSAFTTFVNDPSCSGDACAPTGVEVALDIRPGTCPNPLNPRAPGQVPVAIAGAPSVDVSHIDVSTLRLNGVAAQRASIEDETSSTPHAACACAPTSPDGAADLVLKFSASELVASLGPLADDDNPVLHLTGTFDDGTPLNGQDCVSIVGNGLPPAQAGRGNVTKASALNVEWSHVKKLYR